MQYFPSLFLLCLILSSCSSKSEEYFLRRGNELALQLIEELGDVFDIDDLIDKQPHLRRIFNEQADLIIEARKWQINHKEVWSLDQKSSLLSQELEMEIKRVYAIPVARELLEEYQSSALERIDAFEKKQAMKKNKKSINN
jgi:hypothetical protein